MVDKPEEPTGRKIPSESMFKRSKKFELAGPEDIKITPDNAAFHLGNLLQQLHEVFEGGDVNLDKLDQLAHW